MTVILGHSVSRASREPGEDKEAPLQKIIQLHPITYNKCLASILHVQSPDRVCKEKPVNVNQTPGRVTKRLLVDKCGEKRGPF